MLRRLGTVIVLLVLAGLVPLVGATAEANKGDSPANPVDLDGTISSTLPPTGFAWFRYWNPGDNLEHGVSLVFAPADENNNPEIVFGVWVYENTINGPQFKQIGMGTPSDMPLGYKYWRGSTDVPRNFYIQVVNNSSAPVDYAIAHTGIVFPPPWLSIAPDRSETPLGATPTPTGLPRILFPTATPTPVPEVTGGGTDPQSAVAIDGAPATGRLGPVTRTWFSFYSVGGGRATDVTLTFDPVTDTNRDLITFKVWAYVNTPTGPSLQVIGMGTPSGNPFGPKYWRGGSDAPRQHFLQVINDSNDTTVDYKVVVSSSP
ncbi:MAG: hypothetical protein M1370_11970 [Bacteroidetes bacterium]|nr:hypothetical protein [Bacteroidota bacterium]MCL5025648.1 hypothetical protein [Chloroflexota bacterium]